MRRGSPSVSGRDREARGLYVGADVGSAQAGGIKCHRDLALGVRSLAALHAFDGIQGALESAGAAAAFHAFNIELYGVYFWGGHGFQWGRFKHHKRGLVRDGCMPGCAVGHRLPKGLHADIGDGTR